MTGDFPAMASGKNSTRSSSPTSWAMLRKAIWRPCPAINWSLCHPSHAMMWGHGSFSCPRCRWNLGIFLGEVDRWLVGWKLMGEFMKIWHLMASYGILWVNGRWRGFDLTSNLGFTGSWHICNMYLLLMGEWNMNGIITQHQICGWCLVDFPKWCEVQIASKAIAHVRNT